ncbi:MAG TPA: hypothetical protein VHO50_11945 [Bacteroidales bacterium]|nr:hypothetical protein [Bacteroidales bacterium]
MEITNCSEKYSEKYSEKIIVDRKSNDAEPLNVFLLALSRDPIKNVRE